jgi:hypothetical protein
MKKQIGMDINVGIGDHLFLRIFMDGIKDQYDRIAITHSKPGMAFWHNNDAARWDFNLKLGHLVFSEPPYVLIPNARFPFYPNARIINELNKKPVKPNLDCLCVGTSLNIGKYVVLTTKVRHIAKHDFETAKAKLTPALQRLASKYMVVISGEREVQRTKEYEVEGNKFLVHGLYDYFVSVLPMERTLDLSLPALGVTCSTMPKLQQDCLIMKEAEAVINFGIGGNLWISTCVANRTIGWHNDADTTMDLMQGYPNYQVTRELDQFIAFLDGLSAQ